MASAVIGTFACSSGPGNGDEADLFQANEEDVNIEDFYIENQKSGRTSGGSPSGQHIQHQSSSGSVRASGPSEPFLAERMADSDGSIVLSPEDAVYLALAENFQIKASSYNPKIERAGMSGALAPFDPVPFFEWEVGRTQEPSGSSLEPSKSHRHLYRGGIRGQTPFGTEYTLATQMERSSSDIPFRAFNPQYQGEHRITLSQDLLEGFGSRTNLAEYYARKQDTKAAREEFRSVLNDVILEVKQAYWNFVSARRQVDVSESQLELARQTVTVNRARVESGRIPRVELLRARTREARAREELISAENSASDARDRLLFLISPPGVDPEEWEMNIDPESPLQTEEEQAFTESAKIEEALENRPELAALERSIKASQKRQEELENQLQPELSLEGSYALNSRDQSFSDAFDSTHRGGFQDYSAGLFFSFPLGNRAAESRLRRERLLERQLKVRKKERENEVTVQVREALRSVESARSRVEAARQAEDLAESQLEAESERQDSGLSTTFEVLDSQQEYTESRVLRIQAESDLKKALEQLNRATGTLVDQYTDTTFE